MISAHMAAAYFRVNVGITVKSGMCWVKRSRVGTSSFTHLPRLLCISLQQDCCVGCLLQSGGSEPLRVRSSRDTSSSCRRLLACSRTIKVSPDTFGFDGTCESDEEDDGVVPIHGELGDIVESSGGDDQSRHFREYIRELTGDCNTGSWGS